MKSKHKVGDIVTIKERIGGSSDYKFSFTDTMASKKGQQFKVYRVTESPCGGAKIPDDGYKYELEGSCFNWASSMFEDTTVDESIKDEFTTIDAFVNKKKCPVLDFTLH